MLATFLIAFHSRRIDNLTQTIRFLERNHLDVIQESEILLLCQDQCGVIDNKFKSSRMINMRLACMEKCKVLNFGVGSANSDKIVVLDSDRILPQGYFAEVLSTIERGTAVTTEKMRCLSESVSDEDIIQGTYKSILEFRDKSNAPWTRNLFAGNVVIHKDDYWKAGGMDENYVGYGFEDSDMTNRLLRVGVHGVFRDEEELHLYHEPLSYDTGSKKGDQKRRFLLNGVRYCKIWNIPIPPPLRAEIDGYLRNIL